MPQKILVFYYFSTKLERFDIANNLSLKSNEDYKKIYPFSCIEIAPIAIIDAPTFNPL
jgi:hypothetical protein